jgi:hypothetical protein
MDSGVDYDRWDKGGVGLCSMYQSDLMEVRKTHAYLIIYNNYLIACKT